MLKKILDFNLDKIFKNLKISWNKEISWNNSTYLIRYLYEDIRPLFLILPKMIGHVKTFKKGVDKNKNHVFVYRSYQAIRKI